MEDMVKQMALEQIINILDKVKSERGRIYYFVLDYYSTNAVWDKVLFTFKQMCLKSKSQILILDVPANYINRDDFKAINVIIDRFCSECPNIVKYIDDNGLASDIFEYAETYISGNDNSLFPYKQKALRNGISVKEANDCISDDDKYIEGDRLWQMSELNPNNMKIDKDFDKVLESHYGDKPYWNDFCDSYKKWHERIFNKNKQRKSEFAFIICENNDQYFDECVYYINRLNVPEGYDIDVISIKEADSMCSAYNAAMNSSNARYKIYLHQDVFIRNQNFLYDILAVFQSDPQIGIIGMVGGKNMSILTDWHFGLLDVREPGISFYLVHRESNKKNVEVDAVDGLLIATQYDIPWREDLFTHFDMYDISQSFEMRRAGYKVVVPAQKEPWVIHNSGYAKYKYYAAEREKCINEYPEFFASDKGWFEKYDEEQNNLNNILHDQAKLSFTLRQWDKVRDIIIKYNNSGAKNTDLLIDGVMYKIYEGESMAGVSRNFFSDCKTYDEMHHKYIQTRFLLRRMELGMEESAYEELTAQIADGEISLPALSAFLVYDTVDKKGMVKKLMDIYRNTGNTDKLNTLYIIYNEIKDQDLPVKYI